jgi:hypothetical protein
MFRYLLTALLCLASLPAGGQGTCGPNSINGPCYGATLSGGTVASVNVTTTGTTPATALTLMSITIPAAGSFVITYNVRGASQSVVSGSIVSGLFTGANTTVGGATGGTLVPNSESLAVGASLVGQIQAASTGIFAVNTSGPTTYTVGVWGNGAVGGTAVSDGFGRSLIQYQQIGSSAVNQTPLARVVGHTSAAVACALSPGTVITNWTETVDTTNSFNNTTGVFVAPRTGQYLVTGQVLINSTTVSANGRVGVIPSINGGTFGAGSPLQSIAIMQANATNVPLSINTVLTLTAGQTLSLNAFLDQASACNMGSNPNFTHLEITELQAAF